MQDEMIVFVLYNVHLVCQSHHGGGQPGRERILHAGVYCQNVCQAGQRRMACVSALFSELRVSVI